MKFGSVDGAADLGTLRQKFAPLAQSLGMDWTIRSRAQPQPVLLLASNLDHSLADLPYLWLIGDLAMVQVVCGSNLLRVHYARSAFGALPFHHLPAQTSTPP